eukprot:3575688-Rhodomonas_salina.2
MRVRVLRCAAQCPSERAGKGRGKRRRKKKKIRGRKTARKKERMQERKRAEKEQEKNRKQERKKKGKKEEKKGEKRGVQSVRGTSFSFCPFCRPRARASPAVAPAPPPPGRYTTHATSLVPRYPTQYPTSHILVHETSVQISTRLCESVPGFCVAHESHLAFCLGLVQNDAVASVRIHRLFRPESQIRKGTDPVQTARTRRACVGESESAVGAFCRRMQQGADQNSVGAYPYGPLPPPSVWPLRLDRGTLVPQYKASVPASVCSYA